MKREKEKTVDVSCGDLYQLMIAECRYGYTRNNHLMPWGAFRHCYDYLPKMAKIDWDCACRTAKQLAEEAIQGLCANAFEDGKKQFSIFQKGLENVPTKLDSQWNPDLYRFNVEARFRAKDGIELLPSEKGEPYVSIKATENPRKLAVEFLDFDSDPHDFVFKVFAPIPDKPGWYESLIMLPGNPVLVDEGIDMLFTIERNETNNTKEYEEFIEYCLSMSADSRPYNYEDYEDFLRTHPKPMPKE